MVSSGAGGGETACSEATLSVAVGEAQRARVRLGSWATMVPGSAILWAAGTKGSYAAALLATGDSALLKESMMLRRRLTCQRARPRAIARWRAQVSHAAGLDLVAACFITACRSKVNSAERRWRRTTRQHSSSPSSAFFMVRRFFKRRVGLTALVASATEDA